jgi:hypothetical protein
MRIYAAVVLTLCLVFISKISAQQQSNEYVNRQAPMVHMSGLLRLVETIPLPTEGYMDLWFAKTLSECIFNSLDHCYSQADCDTSRPCSPSSRP